MLWMEARLNQFELAGSLLDPRPAFPSPTQEAQLINKKATDSVFG